MPPDTLGTSHLRLLSIMFNIFYQSIFSLSPPSQPRLYMCTRSSTKVLSATKTVIHVLVCLFVFLYQCSNYSSHLFSAVSTNHYS
ncbi:hypothetical protein F4779DRAFT_584877 [Xylariaceae sp. FL0662B]|nr:hypothetical protein F4779DRAFT_584877 [Xylariaceae sp. FL0662B]